MNMENISILIITFFSMILLINSENSSSKLIFSLILSSTITSILLSNYLKNSWIGISLFMIMVSGLLIMFLMISSIIPKMISPSLKIKFMMSIPFMISSFSLNEWKLFVIKPQLTLFIKMNMIIFIILILNIMLILISKMMKMPMKPFRSI